MKFGYFKNDKYVYAEKPQKNNIKPKTKRLRKKKFWIQCVECKEWFPRYKKTYGTKKDGKIYCHECIRGISKRTI
jgi:formylmethanofuran dehydrogenase subunit E